MKDNMTETVSRSDFLKTLGVAAGAAALGDYGLVHARDLGATTQSYSLNVAPAAFRFGRRPISTIAYNHLLPGPIIRAKRGQKLRVQVSNALKSDTSVHWHGIPIVNKMDGVPGLTQPPISLGANFVYHFPVNVSGTYWYHSHNEIQLDRGLYGPLIIDEPHERLSYDREEILVLDDWRDLGPTHLNARDDLLYRCDLGLLSEHRAGPREPKGYLPPAQPTRYPLHLVSGHPSDAPFEIQVKRGDVVRLRFINAAGGTVYRVAIAGHRMRVTHTDGNPVHPVDVDTLEIGMGERYDVLVYATNPGVWQIAVHVNGEGVRTRAILRYAGARSKNPPADFAPSSLKGKLLTYQMLNATSDVPLPNGRPDMTVQLGLNTRFGSFWITWNGQVVDASTRLHIPLGSRVRFQVVNSGSTQPHPIHLHGHSFKLSTPAGGSAYKDTAIVQPFSPLTYDWIADNPGVWMLHCHNLYHMLAGMMLLLKVK